MITCKKCQSELPDNYTYCIYCSAKLPKTEKNSKKAENPKVKLTNILVAVFACVLIIAVTVMIFVLPW